MDSVRISFQFQHVEFVKQSILEWATVLQINKSLRKFVVPGSVFWCWFVL